jgi:iron complex outermembrane receptor protein
MVRYYFDLGPGELALQGIVSYTDEVYYNLRNYDSHKMDDYTLVNLRMSYMTGDGRWEFAAFLNNATDVENEVMGFDISLFCGCSEIAIGEPRWWGVSAQVSF